ncbi:molybdopterin-dependent oxidoreductase [Nocardioides sp. Iso805N]|uniref:molybdopterin-dependent oxidoreductase n=1 Tax=Nocardioides sp. Iso805N TaxID=1283287 RepID=UPI00035D13EA|nr:molybdopterin-dependent oxidoreductase [Nocardioides sp. Iso805N]
MRVQLPARPHVPVPREESFSSRLRSAAVAARIGLWLGVCFGVAFVTGLVSHYAQSTHQPVPFPNDPVWLYRVTQGLHVTTGTAAIPLLLVKLWAVYPKLFAPLPRRLREIVLVGLERGSIAVLVAGSILELAIGLMNVAQWYAWDFSFKRVHYALAFVVIGALMIHIAVKLPITREALGGDVEDTEADRPQAVRPGAFSRRTLLRTTWGAALLAALVGSSAAGTIRGLDRLAVLSPRSRRSGIPINRTASQVGVAASAMSGSYRCEVVHGEKAAGFSRAELLALPQATHVLPIACVEGWSANGTWTGVPLRTLLDHVGIPRGRNVQVHSLQERGADRVTVLPANVADDERTLVALLLDGQPLSLDHGYPARLMAPDRPGTLQTKWISRIEAL